MVNREWITLTKVEKTDFPAVVRVTVSVSLDNDPDYSLVNLTTVMGEHG
jgi:hypothetical protein